MNIVPFRYCPLNLLHIDLSIITGNRQELRPVGEKLRSSALIGFDMGEIVGDHAVIRLTHRRQRKGICRSAIEDEIHVTVRLKDFPNFIGGFFGEVVIAVRKFKTVIRLVDCFQGLRTHSRVIITRKITFNLRTGL
jgi:hypothetical protein